MNWKVYLIMIGLVSLLLFSSITVSAEVDPTGDLWYWKAIDGTYSWEQYTGSNADIDITSVDYSISGNNATLTMTVAGTIEDDALYFYHMHLIAEDGYYIATYTGGTGMIMGSGGLSGYYSMLDDPVSDNTFTATFTLNNPTATYSIRGYAQQLSSIGDELNVEWWGDWAPNSYFYEYSGYEEPDEEEPDETNDDDTKDDGENGEGTGTPGFEIFALIIGITILIFIYKKKK